MTIQAVCLPEKCPDGRGIGVRMLVE